jgi:hypothetical protein
METPAGSLCPPPSVVRTEHPLRAATFDENQPVRPGAPERPTGVCARLEPRLPTLTAVRCGRLHDRTRFSVAPSGRSLRFRHDHGRPGRASLWRATVGVLGRSLRSLPAGPPPPSGGTVPRSPLRRLTG